MAKRSKLSIVCGALVLSLALAGCVSGGAGTQPVDDNASEPAVEDSVSPEEPVVSDEVDASEGEEQEQPIEADENIMETMTCDLFDASESEELTMMFGYPDLAASVEVGEKDGDTWWVVIFEWDGEDGVVDLREAYLTNSLEMPSYRDGMWIELKSGDRWRNVDWDHDMLVRGQSAFDLAWETLVNS